MLCTQICSGEGSKKFFAIRFNRDNNIIIQICQIRRMFESDFRCIYTSVKYDREISHLGIFNRDNMIGKVQWR